MYLENQVKVLIGAKIQFAAQTLKHITAAYFYHKDMAASCVQEQ